MPANSWRAARRISGVMAAACLVIGSNQAIASTGCDAVNQGSMSGPLANGGTFTQSGFAIGDVLTITPVSVFTGGFRLRDSASAQVAFYLMPNDSGIAQTYTVSTATEAAGMQILFASSTSGATGSVTTTCVGQPTPPPGPSPSSDRSASVTRGFLASRVNGILLNDPSGTSLMGRSGASASTNVAAAGNGTTNVASNGAAAFASAMGIGSGLGNATGLGNAMGLGAGGLGGDAIEASGGKSIQFSQSLSRLRQQAAQSQMQRDRMALGAGEAYPLAYQTASPWDLWVEGRYSAFNDDNGNLDRDGHVGVLYVGGDYRVAENMIVGVLAQFDWAKDDSGILASKVKGNGWMVGPYMSARIHENIFFDLRAAWGRSDNDIDVAGAAGSFDTSRWLVKGTLAGNWVYDAWRITPSAELAYVEESADGFTNSAGTFVAGQNVSLGRLQFGPEIGYRIRHSADTFIEPFAALKGVWDFDNPNVAIIDGFVVGPGDFWGRLQGGLNVATSSGWYIRGLASWDGLGASDYNGYTLQGTVNVPLN